MARTLRMESEAGVYHVLNRGNYRADVFRDDKTKAAFLKCLMETCARTGWLLHAWCIMTNHYHLAISTPRANLVDGMRWLTGTFAVRFNLFRMEHGHMFQGRYKSLVVDPCGGLGPLSHYIHLNPVRAGLCKVSELTRYRWSSMRWLAARGHRPECYDPRPVLAHAGQLADTRLGTTNYLKYLEWLAEDEPARKQQRFDSMSKGWLIGTEDFAKAMVQEHRELAAGGPRLAHELRTARETAWQEELEKLLRRSRRTAADLRAAGKSADWKLGIAAALKARTTVTNRWLGEKLHLGSLHEVSRKVTAWTRNSDPAHRTETQRTTNHKARPR